MAQIEAAGDRRLPVVLVACGPDWRPGAILQAKQQVRANFTDPSPVFSRVQFIGDHKTGQTCGFVSPGGRRRRQPHHVRFIKFDIDRSAGPYIEGELAKKAMTEDAFERAWQNDCPEGRGIVTEGRRLYWACIPRCIAPPPPLRGPPPHANGEESVCR